MGLGLSKDRGMYNEKKPHRPPFEPKCLNHSLKSLDHPIRLRVYQLSALYLWAERTVEHEQREKGYLYRGVYR